MEYAPPIGSKHIVNITGYGSDGEGVARLGDGRAVFVRGAARGDVCEVALMEVTARFCRAEILQIVEPSPYRVAPDCELYPGCGGCDFRHISYEEELYAKKERVDAALSRIGSTALHIDEILTAGQATGYRNKAVFHIARQGNGNEPVIGFYRRGSHDICPVRRCLLLSDGMNAVLARLWSDIAGVASDVALALNAKTITLRAGCPEPVAHKPAVFDVGGLSFRVSAESFFQVNTAAALLLCEKVRGYSAMSERDALLDLYCGVGLFTLFAGQDAGHAVGVESNPAAVRDAKENARRNGFEHIGFVCDDAAHWDSAETHPDCVIIDPPRKGLSKAAVKKLLDLSPERIVYVSCDPATLARDVKLLSGYTPRDVTAVDMFPRTANVECCLLLTK